MEKAIGTEGRETHNEITQAQLPHFDSTWYDHSYYQEKTKKCAFERKWKGDVRGEKKNTEKNPMITGRVAVEPIS